MVAHRIETHRDARLPTAHWQTEWRQLQGQLSLGELNLHHCVLISCILGFWLVILSWPKLSCTKATFAKLKI